MSFSCNVRMKQNLAVNRFLVFLIIDYYIMFLGLENTECCPILDHFKTFLSSTREAYQFRLKYSSFKEVKMFDEIIKSTANHLPVYVRDQEHI